MRAARGNLGILFIAGFGPIVRDVARSRKLYGDVMRIPFKEEPGEYLHTESLSGAKSFALWPLSQAALSCPWGQVVSRFLSPEGLLVGVTFTPMMRESE
jgi:hypothetical protein